MDVNLQRVTLNCRHA